MSVVEQRAKSWGLLSKKFNCKEGVVKFNIGNTFRHELAKFVLCWNLAKEGKQTVTEAIFENGQRADLFVLDTGEAWEVLESETEEEFKKKTASYPCPVFPFKAEEVLKGGVK